MALKKDVEKINELRVKKELERWLIDNDYDIAYHRADDEFLDDMDNYDYGVNLTLKFFLQRLEDENNN